MNSSIMRNVTKITSVIAENPVLIPDFNLDRMIIVNEYGIIGGICAAMALILASHQIIMHLYFFNEPKLQLFIVRILLMVPVFKIY
jgi:hypothetical protein